MGNALCGGWTSPIHLFKDVFSKKNSKIFYVDFNSSYPFIQHKTVMNNKECFKQLIKLTKLTSSDKEGMEFAKCTILPPRKLFIPTLPFRLNGKLLFPLCAQCGKEKQTNECKHNDK